MTQQNLITLDIPQQDLKAIKDAIATLRVKLLPHLKALKAEDRVALPKMGDKSVAFVTKALEHCNANPELAPPFLDINEFKSDVDAAETLRSLHAPLLQITDSLSDSMLLAGSDSLSAALMFYNSVHYAQKSNIAKAGTIYKDLSERFPGRKSVKAVQQ
ncbi:MAG TPA: hypothetical protein PK358_12055 [Spirochaetota bacterium]|nr:hypothetical protein [Spirochaetota bacterium]HPJ35564.1 hypothetical protein [Spirochaetota bacterium]